METKVTTVGIVTFKDEILLLKRTSDRRSSPDLWQTVSGFIKEYESAEDAVLRELKEETGLEGEIETKGDVFEVEDKWGRWVVIPFLISVNSKDVDIDSDEHMDYAWIIPEEIKDYDCVKGVEKDLKAVGRV